MKRTLLVCTGLALLCGCAALQQGKADYDLGKTTLAEQGTTGAAEGLKAVEPFLPYVPEPLKPFAAPLATLIGLAVTWNVGRKARKGQSPTNPITGFLGRNTGVEFALQQLVTVLIGGFRIVEVLANKGKTTVATVLPVKDAE